MKKIIICCFALLLFVSSYAQEGCQKKGWDAVKYYNSERERIRDSAEFIFQGVTNSIDYYNRIDKNGKEYVAYSRIVKVTKVFRGKIRPGTVVEIVGKTSFQVITNEPRKTRDLNGDSLFVFFCRLAKEFPYDPKYNISPVDNKIILTSFSDIGNISIIHQTGLRKKFASKGEIYRYISTFPNIKMPVISKEDTVFPDRIIHKPMTLPGHTKDYIDSVKRVKESKKKIKSLTLSNSGIIPVPATEEIIRTNVKAPILKPYSSKLKSATDDDYVDIIYDGYDYTANSKDITFSYNGSNIDVTLTYDAELEEDDINIESAVWSSSDESIVKVVDNTNGEFKIIKGPGTATINLIVTYDYQYCYTDPTTQKPVCFPETTYVAASVNIVVTVPATGVDVEPKIIALMYAGTSSELIATPKPSYGTYKIIQWYSSDLSIATINDNCDGTCTVYAISSGTVNVYAILTLLDGTTTYKDNCSITVYPYINNIIASPAFNAGDNRCFITISGQGFGNSQGKSYISFTTADDATGTMYPDPDSYDYLTNWSPTQIQMWLPGQVSYIYLYNETIGTGDVNFTYIDANNNQYTSNCYNIIINHNYLQYISPDGSHKYCEKPHETSVNTIAFSLDTHLSNNAKNAINRAMADWNCALSKNGTPINFTINQGSPNQILIGYPNNDNAMETDPSGTLNTAGQDCYLTINTITINKIMYNNNIFSFTLPGQGIIDATEDNFYFDILHEFGHVLALGHVNNADDLMNYTVNNVYGLSNPNNDNYALVDAQTRITASENRVWITASCASTCIGPSSPVLTATKNGSYKIDLNWTYSMSDVDSYNPPSFDIYRDGTLISWLPYSSLIGISI